MNSEEIIKTPIWVLYEKGRNFHRLKGIYSDTDRNYEFYNGNQWLGANLGDVEPIQKNFIKPIVKYKVGIIHDNLYAINYSSQNYDNPKFRIEADKICELLNRKAAIIWENNKMDYKGRRITKDAAINDEGLIYNYFDKKKNDVACEIVKKNDVYYGDENSDDIESQPYILIRKRMPVSQAQDFALKNGIADEKLDLIKGDIDTFELSGNDSKEEVDPQTTLVYKFYKKDGTVYCSCSAERLIIFEDKNQGTQFYPLAHLVWEEKEGFSRGEGEVRYLIPNQIEVNRTALREVLTAKLHAYPKTVYNAELITNPNDINKVGSLIKVKGGATVADVENAIRTLAPTPLSPDVRKLQEDLIQTTRELAGAGDIATGQVNPDTASGRAILAIQQASQSPITEQKEAYKTFVEDLARIWLDMLIANCEDKLKLYEEEKDETTGEVTIKTKDVTKVSLEKLRASVKVDITPKGAFDKYAQEISIENLLKAGFFNVNKLQELKIYAKLLDDDSTMPKTKLESAIKLIEQEQFKIAEINNKARVMKQRASMFLNNDLQSQANMILDSSQEAESDDVNMEE